MDLSLFWYHTAWVKQATLNSTYFKMGNSLLGVAWAKAYRTNFFVTFCLTLYVLGVLEALQKFKNLKI